MSLRIAKPLRLKAITLRGIGPYLYGARLEIRPLTVLCGENGSGKSTWLNVLNLLRNSVGTPCFPFKLTPGRKRELGSFANAFLYSLRPEITDDESREHYLAKLDTSRMEDDERNFGPLGTIGIEAEVTGPLELPDGVLGQFRELVDPTPAQEMFWNFRWRPGTEICVRLTLPELTMLSEGLIELVVDGEVVARFRKQSESDVYVLTVPPHLLPFFRDDGSVSFGPPLAEWDVPMARVQLSEDGESLRTESAWPGRRVGEHPDLFGRRAVNQIRLVIGYLLDGLFHLGAIRRIMTTEEIKQTMEFDEETVILDEDEPIVRRWVGEDGSWVHRLHAWYCGYRMVQANPPRGGLVDESFGWLTTEFRPDVIGEARGGMGLETDSDVSAYLFEMYYAVWMKYLVGAYPESHNSHGLSFGEAWVDETVKPTGYIVDGVPEDELDRQGLPLYWDSWRRYWHPCFYVSGEPTGPQGLSAGFHQVAPMVVQAGLMRMNEILCVENPEVHLHPSLQSRICEFFINEAKCGKHIILETHSDLIVYRILRAILEETIPQEGVRIYFCQLRNVETRGYAECGTTAYSEVERIEIDDRGRVSNWPPGFMDQEMMEFEQLMNALPRPFFSDDLDDGEED